MAACVAIREEEIIQAAVAFIAHEARPAHTGAVLMALR